ncbi:NTP transferase domain-containing protein [Catellatospora sp. NPDC049111]|uniref:nucleotidyltransferase family protein n=1 Tax=Catellatospora sp. NPDC049111 TaxID=3155271 RepID=UPI0034082448
MILPVGGLGSRARDVTGDTIPKHLITLRDGRTVLDMVLHGLQAAGLSDFVLGAGHHADAIEDFVAAGSWRLRPDAVCRVVREARPLGPDGAVLNAITGLDISGQCLALPGDLALPWHRLVDLVRTHRARQADITMATTSLVTARTTDVGHIVAEFGTDRLLWCHARDEARAPARAGARILTSAAALAFSCRAFSRLCAEYTAAHGPESTLNMRDQVLPWAIRRGGFELQIYDLFGEILDIGTPSAIRYAQQELICP